MDDIRYVYDTGGNKVSVLIPVEMWERTLQVENPKITLCNFQKYYGIYRDLITDPEAVAHALRDEWNRV